MACLWCIWLILTDKSEAIIEKLKKFLIKWFKQILVKTCCAIFGNLWHTIESLTVGLSLFNTVNIYLPNDTKFWGEIKISQICESLMNWKILIDDLDCFTTHVIQIVYWIYDGHEESGEEWWRFWVERDCIGGRWVDFMWRWCKQWFCLGQRSG